MLVLSDGDVEAALDLSSLLDVVAEAFRKQGAGEVERPDRPHFPVGAGLGDDPGGPMGTGLTMPAYVHGADHYATKLASVHEGNERRGLPTVQAQVVLTEADTGTPAALLAGTRITNARTGCIGGLAARELAESPVRLGIVGAGTQARWQARAIAAATEIEWIRIDSPSDSRRECARDLRDELGVEVTATDSPRAAVEDATVVVTATTATDPVFPGGALRADALVVAVGAYTAEMRELDETTVDRAARIYADVPEAVATVGDFPDLTAADLVPFASVLSGDSSRPEGIVVVDSVGTAVLDAATAEHVYEAAERAGLGTETTL